MEKTFRKLTTEELENLGEVPKGLEPLMSIETRLDGANKPYEYTEIVWVDTEALLAKKEEIIIQKDLQVAEIDAQLEVSSKKK